MKNLIALLTLAATSAFAQLQTNTYTATLVPQKNTTTGACSGYHYVGVAAYHPTPYITNRWYIADTNHMSVASTNFDALIIATSTFGQTFCGHGIVQINDTNYPDPNCKWAYTLFWSNNVVPVPTNHLISVQVFGVHTNL